MGAVTVPVVASPKGRGVAVIRILDIVAAIGFVGLVVVAGLLLGVLLLLQVPDTLRSGRVR